MAYAIYTSEIGSTASRLIAGNFCSLEAAKIAFVEHVTSLGFEIVCLDKDEEGHDAYDAAAARGNECRVYQIETHKAAR